MARLQAQLMVLDQAHPSRRKIGQAAQILSRGGVIAYPTDTVYGIGCDLHNRKGIDRIYKIKNLDRGHPLTFICQDLSNISDYARVSDYAYHWLRRLLPGPYTVILPASKKAPSILRQKRSEVGIRVSDHPVCGALVRSLGNPVISTSAVDPITGGILIDPDVVKERLGKKLDLILDAGLLPSEESTVLRLVGDKMEIIRRGQGSLEGIA